MEEGVVRNADRTDAGCSIPCSKDWGQMGLVPLGQMDRDMAHLKVLLGLVHMGVLVLVE